MPRRNQKLVPGSEKALDAMKYELAAELGLMGGSQSAAGANTEFASELGSGMSGGMIENGYWGNVAARDTGRIGGNITARLIRQAEEALLSL